jgi:hypothetical protein
MAHAQAANRNPAALAAELCLLLARNAAQAERDRPESQENIESLEPANLFKLMTPQRRAGSGVPLAITSSVHAEPRRVQSTVILA